ncbi:MAG TPA: bifunctional (p)ppGpp synthetase/guanosine-3',5'-bis(diphosphate) 3'-pyrophosphohydrolase [Chthonomonas sp.]|uniref:RelA/SpoT family protein n=1 Tax=Chthonomonas sp. TaxID=2282153 RepID=UPI002B4B78CD|nr:bifunctional (p)ppGpp synthetase/guanosine-3',5'-bis(diphosphate) 3'-pyrophosphohydrolase [Chthonomonas sp.]HLH81569.1 bifunctional (p)ppGpp synthetase/guanosine-3',5'-bis(diphosphate) 3'-pyrophosphohydrolase [Chthonomonas sp.]
MSETTQEVSITPQSADNAQDLENILERLATYRPEADKDLVRRAYAFAAEKHCGQTRSDGSPYITHPLAVTAILAELEMDETTLAAALLHDVIEDCGVPLEEIQSRFGPAVAQLVDGVTKLQIIGVDEGKTRPNLPEDEEELTPTAIDRRKKQAEMAKKAANLRKIFLAMARDLRVIVIKLADRLHNMRTLSALPPARQMRIAQETLQIFAPLAHRLGIWRLKWELEDLAFRYVEPEAYEQVAAMVARTRAERQAEVDEAVAILQQKLKEEGIDAQVMGRPKHLYSIYNKMRQQGLDFTQLYDLIALRVIVPTRPDCYHALGVVSALWAPIPGMFSDYIAQPKSNMYQSIHIKVIGPKGTPLEVQIRTWEMHRTAEFGVAAHWQYKEGGKANDQFERRLAFLRQQLFDWQNDSKDSGEFLRNITEDLFTDQVFVLTPKGDVIDLPAGSCPIDFAYRVHSEVGDHCVGAKVNGRLVPLSYQFRNGDTVEIITRPGATPSRDWLAFVKTSHARAKIKNYFKRLHHRENVQRGRDLLEKELANQLERDPHRWGENPRDLLKDESLRSVAASFNVPSEIELLASIGYGTIAPLTVLNRLRPVAPTEGEGAGLAVSIPIGGKRASEEKLHIVAGGLDTENLLFRRSRCCLPIPGDDVIGYITRGRGMALHRRECPNARYYLANEPDRCVPVEYVGNDGQVYQVYLTIVCLDRTGLLADIGSVFGENKTNITALRTQSHRDKTATLELAIEVRNTEHLDDIIKKVYAIGDILDVHRAFGSRDEGKTK